MTIVRYALIGVLGLSPAALAAETTSGKADAPAPEAQLSKAEQDRIKQACQLEHTYRADRTRLITLREHALGEGDQKRVAEIDGLGRELDA